MNSGEGINRSIQHLGEEQLRRFGQVGAANFAALVAVRRDGHSLNHHRNSGHLVKVATKQEETRISSFRLLLSSSEAQLLQRRIVQQPGCPSRNILQRGQKRKRIIFSPLHLPSVATTVSEHQSTGQPLSVDAKPAQENVHIGTPSCPSSSHCSRPHVGIIPY